MTVHRVLVGSCLVLREYQGENLVLMVTGQDGWVMPGGHVDARDFRHAERGSGETWSAAHVAAARELDEETGLKAERLARIFVAESDVRVPALVHVFHVLSARGRVVPNAEPGTHARWFSWFGWPSGSLDGFFREHFPRGVQRYAPTEFHS